MVVDEFNDMLSPEQQHELELLMKGEKVEEMLNWIDRTLKELTNGQWNLDMYLRMNPVSRFERLKNVVEACNQDRKDQWTT